jgi:hypothetical protein
MDADYYRSLLKKQKKLHDTSTDPATKLLAVDMMPEASAKLEEFAEKPLAKKTEGTVKKTTFEGTVQKPRLDPAC